MISGDFSNFLNTQRFYLKCPALKVSYNMNGHEWATDTDFFLTLSNRTFSILELYVKMTYATSPNSRDILKCG